MTGTISNCTTSGAINMTGGIMQCIGGVAGSIQATATNCISNMSMTLNSNANKYAVHNIQYVGGIIGRGYTITNCTTNATITASASNS